MWRAVATLSDIDEFLADAGGKAVIKTARGGYDGKGVRVVTAPDDVADWLSNARDGGPKLLAEEAVDFDRELAIQVARRPSGEIRTWPVVESIQRGGICSEVIAPAPGFPLSAEREVRRMAELIATKLDVTGVLTVEMFQAGERLLVNELAMRPHNSGHWTIDAAVTSQFEQHLRAVLDLPLGDTAALASVAVMANVLGGAREVLPPALADVVDGGAKVHLYGKEVRPGRKVGHITVMGDDVDEVYRRAVAAAAIVRDGSGTKSGGTEKR
jgi:5-(carboxyamino)imidazole ribonucleotide synthase